MTSRGGSSWRRDAWVAVATVGAGLLGYAFNVVLSRALGPSGFGELSALLAVAILAIVPGTAVQAGIARRLAVAPSPATERRLLGESVVLAVAVGAVVLAVGPLLRAELGVRSTASIVWLAVSMIPTTVAYGCLGVLQGRRRFLALGWLLLLVQGVRLVAALLAAASGTGIVGALAAVSVLTTLVAVVAVARLGAPVLSLRVVLLREALARDTGVLLGVLLLSNLDVVLARHYLSPHAAGLYAAGNLVTKAAFWGAGFVPTVTYPLLSQPAQRAAAVRRGVRLLAGLSVVATVAAAAGAPLLPAVLGASYRPVAHLAWLFALQGAALAGVLFAVYAGLAVRRHGLGLAVWLVAAVESAAVAARWHDSVEQVLLVVVCGSAALLAGAVAAALRRNRASSRVRSWHRIRSSPSRS
ncbi:MAG TPA: oligosaccharide flippase family protein [Jatrophihabitans sp.]|nr:oligosaccharide flippase family protein [Jatrophihabitans sp.]